MSLVNPQITAVVGNFTTARGIHYANVPGEERLDRKAGIYSVANCGEHYRANMRADNGSRLTA